MPGRESVEDRIARILDAKIAERDKRAAEEKDPNKAWLRSAIREEVQAALAGLLGDEGDAKGGRKRSRPDEGGDEDGGILSGLFGS